MPSLRTIILSIMGLNALLALIFIPDWFEDPRELAIGEWRDAGKRGYLEVDETHIRTRGLGARGSISYEWVQTEDEPYTMQLTWRHYTITAHITFDGPDTAIADLDVMRHLPREAARIVKKQNKAAGRPENEFRMVFFRTKVKK